MSEETHIRAESDEYIYRYQEECSLEVLIFVSIQVKCIDRKQWHRESTASDCVIFRQIHECESDEQCRPEPEEPDIPAAVMDFDDTTDHDKKEYIAEYMQYSSMQKAIEQELQDAMIQRCWIRWHAELN